MNIYDIEVTRIDGITHTLAEYSGKVLLIVNIDGSIAPEKRLEQAETITGMFSADDVMLLAFTSMDSTNEQVQSFFAGLDVTFPIFSKVEVSGSGIHPLYAHLTNEIGEEVTEPFTTFLISRTGEVINRFNANKSIGSMRGDINALL